MKSIKTIYRHLKETGNMANRKPIEKQLIRIEKLVKDLQKWFDDLERKDNGYYYGR